MLPKDSLRSTISFMLALGFTFSCVKASGQATDRQQTAEQKRLELRKKVDKARQQIDESVHTSRFKNQQLDYEQRCINELAAAEIKYRAAKKNKDSDRSGYVSALVELAQAYFNTKEYQRASQFASEAYTQYALLGKNSTEEPACREQIWKVVDFLPSDEFQKRFEDLFRAIEAKKSSDDEVRSALSGVSNVREHIEPDGVFDRAKLLKSLIDIGTSIRGAKDQSLYWYLEQYADECKTQNRFPEARAALDRMAQLNPSTTDKWQSALVAKVHLATLCVNFGMLDKSDSMLPSLLSEIKPGFDTMAAHEFGQLAYGYISAARLADADKITSALLEVANDSILSAIGSVSAKLVEAYTLNMSFDKARALLIKRVAASERCERDYEATVVRLQLSNIDLALGDEAESNRLFEQVKKLTALRGSDMERLLTDRAKLIDALKK
ncbi:MAG: hypothetical protein U0103_09615 [Candidatus Obscuribacterales bacterium]